MPDFDRGYSQLADAAGAATVTVRPRSSGGMVVRQVAVETPTASQGTCYVRKNGWLVSPAALPADALAGDPPVELGSADELTVEFEGQPASSECRVTVFWWEP